jgi:hypothetical protein
MEIVRKYRPVLKNEVPVYRQPMEHLFKNYNVYVFGYGSLLTSEGWRRRGMLITPTRKDLIECELKGFERGPFGMYGKVAYYGIIRNARKRCNGVLGKIHNLRDWVNLMRTEMVAGLTHHVNYRVIDVTEDVCNIVDAHKLKSPYKIHAVCNRPANKSNVLKALPAPGYYSYCWNRILLERSDGFAKMFLKTGGFKHGYEVAKYLDKEAGCDDC